MIRSPRGVGHRTGAGARAVTDMEAMRLALIEARAAAAAGEVPVGAVVLAAGEVVGRGRNRVLADGDPTAHAEVVAIRDAATRLGPRLDGATLVATMEPCPMCAGALLWTKVARLIYGCADPKAGACGSVLDVSRDPRLPHRLEVVGGVLRDEAAALLRTFFAERR